MLCSRRYSYPFLFAVRLTYQRRYRLTSTLYTISWTIPANCSKQLAEGHVTDHMTKYGGHVTRGPCCNQLVNMQGPACEVFHLGDRMICTDHRVETARVSLPLSVLFVVFCYPCLFYLLCFVTPACFVTTVCFVCCVLLPLSVLFVVFCYPCLFCLLCFVTPVCFICCVLLPLSVLFVVFCYPCLFCLLCVRSVMLFAFL